MFLVMPWYTRYVCLLSFCAIWRFEDGGEAECKLTVDTTHREISAGVVRWALQANSTTECVWMCPFVMRDRF